MSDLYERLEFFQRRIVQQMEQKNYLARRFVETDQRLRTSADRVQRTVNAANSPDRELVAQIADADQSLAAARETLKENDERRVLLRFELQALVDALAAVRQAIQMCDKGDFVAAESICRSVGII